MPDPTPGEFFRHYKGKVTVVLAVAVPMPRIDMGFSMVSFNAKHVDDGLIVGIHKTTKLGRTFFWFDEKETYGPLAIYVCTGEIWARDLEEFKGILADGTPRFSRLQLS